MKKSCDREKKMDVAEAECVQSTPRGLWLIGGGAMQVEAGKALWVLSAISIFPVGSGHL